jgi:hypothetical protein
MTITESWIKRIMLVSGVLTCSTIYAALAPEAALKANFGETLDGPLAEIIVRNWGILVTLIGCMLIYGAFTPAVRAFALVVAGTSKLLFGGLVLAHGGRYLGQPAALAVAIDLVWVALFAWYLVGLLGKRV